MVSDDDLIEALHELQQRFPDASVGLVVCPADQREAKYKFTNPHLKQNVLLTLREIVARWSGQPRGRSAELH